MKRTAEGIRVYHRCGGCGKKQEFLNSKKFRVNANGNKIDVYVSSHDQIPSVGVHNSDVWLVIC